MTEFADLADLPEDKRIEIIGHRVMVHREKVSFLVDDWKGKAERYSSKLRARFPGIVVHPPKKFGPVRGVMQVNVDPPEQLTS